METEMWQRFLGSLQGKFTSSSLPSFSAHITISLGYFSCVSVSPVTSEFPTGREWAISIFHSPRALTERPINTLEQGRVVTEHAWCRRGPGVDLTSRSGRTASSLMPGATASAPLLWREASPGCSRIHNPGWLHLEWPLNSYGSKNGDTVSLFSAQSTPCSSAAPASSVQQCVLNESLNTAILGSLRTGLSTSNCMVKNNPKKRGSNGIDKWNRCPASDHLWMPALWERNTLPMTSKANRASWLKSLRYRHSTSCLATSSHGQTSCAFLSEHQGCQWQCHMQAGRTGRLSCASIAPETSAGPVRASVFRSLGASAA